MTWANYLDQRPKFNIPTRGMPTNYESVGYLKDDNGNLQKLVGEKLIVDLTYGITLH